MRTSGYRCSLVVGLRLTTADYRPTLPRLTEITRDRATEGQHSGRTWQIWISE